MIIVGVN